MFNGWELIAQQDGYFKHDLRSNEKTWTEETHYAVSQPNGQVLALFNPQGKRTWRKQPTSLWGLPLLNHWERKQSEPINPNLLFAGQYLDDESGLAYNRFRYYDPESGNYLSSDPIGLQGGETPYGYVHNPMGWVDPFGLSKCTPNSGGQITYRGDSRSPSTIFNEGFKTLGNSDDLLLHAIDNTNPPSNFISTSTSPDVATNFATGFGTRDGFVYAIKPKNGIDVNATLGSKSPYPTELEIAVPGGISPKDILGATPVYKDGSMANFSILNINRR